MIDVDDIISVRAMSEKHERLRQAREAQFESATKAADALGVKPSTYRAHENGQNDFEFADAQRYAKKFRVDPFWIMTGVERDSELKAVTDQMAMRPNRGLELNGIPEIETRAGAGGGGLDLSIRPDNTLAYTRDAVRSWWEIPDQYLSELKMRRKGAYLIEVTGDSMYDPAHPGAPGSIFPGDRLIVDTNDQRPSPPGAFAVWDGMGVVVKMVELVPNTDPPRIRMVSRNPLYSAYEATNEEAHIIGRVRAKISIM